MGTEAAPPPAAIPAASGGRGGLAGFSPQHRPLRAPRAALTPRRRRRPQLAARGAAGAGGGDAAQSWESGRKGERLGVTVAETGRGRR